MERRERARVHRQTDREEMVNACRDVTFSLQKITFGVVMLQNGVEVKEEEKKI